MPSGGSNRKLSFQLKTEGGYRADRHANRADAVQPAKGQPSMPDGLSEDQQRLWQTVVDNLPPQALGEVDTAALVELVQCYRLMTECRDKLANDPTCKVTRLAYTSYFDRWLRLAAEFGCTPTSRARLQVPPKKEEPGPVQELLMRRMGLH